MQDRALDVGAAAGAELAGAFAADDDVAAAAAATAAPPKPPTRRAGGPPLTRCSPRQREVLDGRLVDLRQRAEAPAGVVAGIGRPGIGRAACRAPRDRDRPVRVLRV